MAAASSIRPPRLHTRSRSTTPPAHTESRKEEEVAAGPQGPSLRALRELDPAERERRLRGTRRGLSNRRKILVKNLPQDITNQEVHDILREYELKYCYVDRNKGTAFVTLLNGEQAQDAIHTFHQTTIRGRDITVQLQPTDSLLCITNLPHTFTDGQFEELVRAYGNIERCFLVYSELTGHSKGYGFVEYMKKDSASRARSELLGKLLVGRTLVVQWTDVNQLTAELLHSKCLCVDKLPLDFCDTEELTQIFSSRYKPVFCQLAQDEDSHVRGFAVVEYETAEQAEDVLTEMDRQVIGGQEIRVSLCTPGTSGRSTLAALIAAQGVMSSSKKGLLPEPSLAQLLSSMSNPAALQVLLRPYQASKRGGKFGRPQGLPFLRPPLTAALLQLGKVQQQNALLGNGLVLQNLLHMQLAQQQLLQIKDKHLNSGPSLLGDPSRVLLHKAMSLRTTGSLCLGKGLLGDSPNELPQDGAQTSSQAPPVATAGILPYLPSRQHLLVHSASGEQNGSPAMDKQVVTTQPGLQTYILQGAPPKAQHGLHVGGESGASGPTPPCNQTSLLGEPPKDLKIPSNPYLNLASVLPGMVLQAAPPSNKPASTQPHNVVYGGVLGSTPQHPQGSGGPQYGSDTIAEYSQQYSQPYTPTLHKHLPPLPLPHKEAVQQWYQHYQAQGYSSTPQETAASEYTKEQAQISAYTQTTASSSESYYSQATTTTTYGDYSTYMQAVNHYYAQNHVSQAAVPAYQQRESSKDLEAAKASVHSVTNGNASSLPPGGTLPCYSAMPLLPGYVAPTSAPQPQTSADWNHYYYNQARGQKREYPHLPAQDGTADGSYVGQHSQGLGGQYVDYFKKKRI